MEWIKHVRLKYWVVPILLLVGMIAASVTGIFPIGKAQKQEALSAAVTVKADTAKLVKTYPKLSVTGTVEGVTSAIVSANSIGLSASAKIVAVMVEDGQKVSAGQQLIRIESDELANSVKTATNGVQSAKANLENIRANYNRNLTLYQQNAISKQQLDSAETQMRVAENDLSSAYANLSTSEKQYSYTSITAPVSGVVANKAAVIGQVVAAGQQLMTVEDIGQVYAVVNIEQKDLASIMPGTPAEITVDSYPGQIFSGTVALVNPAAAVSNRMYRTKIKLDNADGKLKPGMFVKAGIVKGAETTVLVVPQSAIYQKQGLFYVYVIEEDKVNRRLVEVGDVIGDGIEIKSGLKENAAVAASNVNNLKDGDAVVVTK